ncbi:MAG: response regulator, partial [Bacteroidales bacterium]|nr:response regulator [Bacteroidales bacterium]
LIVEDDEVSLFLLKEAIMSISAEVFVASDGVQAIEKCKSHPDIDLVLMDIKLPVMSGYEATKRIRQFNKEVIIIAQTAFVLPGDKEKAIGAGCNDYISKPIHQSELIDKIAGYFSPIT